MEINDFKDTIELDNVTRRMLDEIRDSMNRFDTDGVDDLTALRFATLVVFGLIYCEDETNEVVQRAMTHALVMARADPAIVEQDLFRS